MANFVPEVVSEVLKTYVYRTPALWGEGPIIGNLTEGIGRHLLFEEEINR